MFEIVTGVVEHLGGRPPKPLRDVLAGVLPPFGLNNCTRPISRRVGAVPRRSENWRSLQA